MSNQVAVKVMKKPIHLIAVQMSHAGKIVTDRNEELAYVPGDWILTEPTGERWPVSDRYLRANYDFVTGGNGTMQFCPHCGDVSEDGSFEPCCPDRAPQVIPGPLSAEIARYARVGFLFSIGEPLERLCAVSDGGAA